MDFFVPLSKQSQKENRGSSEVTKGTLSLWIAQRASPTGKANREECRTRLRGKQVGKTGAKGQRSAEIAAMHKPETRKTSNLGSLMACIARTPNSTSCFLPERFNCKFYNNSNPQIHKSTLVAGRMAWLLLGNLLSMFAYCGLVVEIQPLNR